MKQRSDLHIGEIVWVRGEAYKSKSEAVDLWQPEWNENQTVLASAIHTLDRDAGPLEGAAAGSWSLGIVEESQGKGCYWLWTDWGDVKEEIVVGHACGRKPGSHGSKGIVLNQRRG